MTENKGFSLLELMLVIAVVGILVAVVVPRAWRANIDTKYATLKQTCVQLAGFANDWAERQLETQDRDFPHVLDDYMATLTDSGGTDTWIAAAGNANNWSNAVRAFGTPPNVRTPTAVVKDLVSQDQPLRNPFNGLGVFEDGNDSEVQGAIACASVIDTDPVSGDDYNYYALVFQSTSGWYAGQDPTNLAGLRNGVFIARLIQ
jgi:prepilin-type N-terminal cleavage/methylation domain-containing protein